MKKRLRKKLWKKKMNEYIEIFNKLAKRFNDFYTKLYKPFNN